MTHSVHYRPIGIIRTPHSSSADTPIQPRRADGIRGRVELFPEFQAGLQDLDGFSHLILLYHFHGVTETRLRVVPFMDSIEHGIFATRAPVRPNPIGLSVVRLLAIADTTLTIENVDMLDETPLLDIKPYVPQFDYFETPSIGWLASSRWSEQPELDERQ